MLYVIFVRSVEDGLEPSQTYDEVNKLLLLHIYVIRVTSLLGKVVYFLLAILKILLSDKTIITRTVELSVIQ